MWGKGQTYYISVITQDDLTFYAGELYLEDDLPRLSFSAGDANEYFVRWNRSKYYNAVDSFVLFQDNESDYSICHKVKSTNNVNDTTFQVTEGAFGDRVRFSLYSFPKRPI